MRTSLYIAVSPGSLDFLGNGGICSAQKITFQLFQDYDACRFAFSRSPAMGSAALSKLVLDSLGASASSSVLIYHRSIPTRSTRCGVGPSLYSGLEEGGVASIHFINFGPTARPITNAAMSRQISRRAGLTYRIMSYSATSVGPRANQIEAGIEEDLIDQAILSKSRPSHD